MKQPHKWREALLPVIRDAFAAGGTLEQAGKACGVHRSTVGDWRDDPDIGPAVRAAIAEGQAAAVQQVEHALYRNAVGAVTEEVVHEEKVTKDGQVVPVTKTVRREQKPDVVAEIFYLTNRAPDRWKDVRKIEHEGQAAQAGPTIVLVTGGRPVAGALAGAVEVEPGETPGGGGKPEAEGSHPHTPPLPQNAGERGLLEAGEQNAQEAGDDGA